jgi:glutamate synthase domain-containing protein 3
VAAGVTIELTGHGNDYVGKGLSGGKLIIRPSAALKSPPDRTIMVGNTVLYGATSGRAFFRGLAGERFAVRNSGVSAVVEGVGDHGCEYMTGGRVVVLGLTGRNFAAGMSGGIAFVLDKVGDFAERCNTELVELETPNAEDFEEIRALVEEHRQRTGSTVATHVLSQWEHLIGLWVKVMPTDYRRALAEQAAKSADDVAHLNGRRPARERHKDRHETSVAGLTPWGGDDG